MAIVRRIIAAGSSGRIALVAAGFILAAIGAKWQWIFMPISHAVSGFHVGYVATGAEAQLAAPIVSQGLIFLLVALLATIGEFIGYSRFRRIVAALAMALLLYHPIYLICIDGRWIETFVAQANARQNSFNLLNTYFVPNTGLDITFQYITDFSNLLDRLQFAWEALGKGWLVAFFGASILIITPEPSGEATSIPLAMAGVALTFSLLFLVFGVQTLWGEHLRSRAEAQVAAGSYAAALKSFTNAIAADPIWGRSTSLMVEISKAFYELKGPRDHYAMLYLASQAIQNQQYDKGFALLSIISNNQLEDFGFRAPYLQAAAKTARAGHIFRGVSEFALGGPLLNQSLYALGNEDSLALHDFELAEGTAVEVDPQPVDVNFMLARVEFDSHQYQSCIERAERMINTASLSNSTEGNFYTTAGDCYAGAGEYGRARDAYTKSGVWDDRENYRATQDVSGS